MNQVKVALFIQVLNSFVGGIFFVVLPLMMTERNISVATMGLIFAALPLIFQLGRMVFAVVSDFWGRKPFFLLNGILSVGASLIYYLAQAPLEFLFGKTVEGTKDGSLWAVNRAFLLEKSEKKWTVLVHLRTMAYVAFGVGCLLAGFFVVWFLYEGTLLMCTFIGAFVIPASLLLVNQRKERFDTGKALRLLDFRKKGRTFNTFLVLLFVMGLSFGLRSGYVFPQFLRANGFNIEIVGVLVGLQIFFAGFVSYVFARRFGMKKLLIVSGVLYTGMLALLGFSTSVLAGVLVVVYGVVEGLMSICQEGILASLSREGSYGIDIGLLMMGLHAGDTLSLAIAGFLIEWWGFAPPFLLSAAIYVIFFAGSYHVLKNTSL